MKPSSPHTETALIVHDSPCLNLARRQFEDGDPILRSAVEALRSEADAALQNGPYTIVDKAFTPPSGDKHDYVSRGPYWWPNPDTEDGLPYVRRDGETNPERESFDRPKLRSLLGSVEPLALGWHFTQDDAYADWAVHILRTFFLNERTRMNPNLNFGQGIPGRCEGRGIGIIETTGFATRLIDALLILRSSQAMNEEDWQGLKSWFADYLDWMLESPHGQDEARKENNHGTSYDLQVATFARFVGRKSLAREVLSHAGARRIATQVEPDGTQPYELARTKALSYASMNLNLYIGLASVADKIEIDLWHYTAPNGGSIRKALDWLVPYWTQSEPWPYEQIAPFPYEERALNLLRKAAWAYEALEYEEAIVQLPIPQDDLASATIHLYYPSYPPTSRQIE